MKLRIENEGDEDTNVWAVINELDECLYASYDKSKCEKFIKSADFTK